ncbi:MAG: NAD(P)H-dependent oxidoreductase subunit E [Kiritimatiellae bacterium]|nr:NAD(P)H-dependent oxidoreductase subunit E [Kiritimatiellia bacterium]
MMIHPLLPELIRLQRRDRYLAPDALAALSKQLTIPVNRIISVASFYQAFRFKPCGKHQIKVCIGAACYVKGAEKLYDAFADYLDLAPGEDTSEDGLFTLSKVACLGCCMLAVAIQIDRHIFGHVTPDDIPRILDEFLMMAGEEETSAANAITGGTEAEIRVCRCSSCRAAGSDRIFEALTRACHDERLLVTVKEVGCHGMSYRAPIVTVVCPDAVYHYDHVQETDIHALLNNHFKPTGGLRRISWESKRFLDRFYSRHACSCSAATQMDTLINATRLVTRNSGVASPESLDDYRQGGGLLAFEKALILSPEAIIAQLKQAKLRGRGGGGFPTGEKWRLAYEAPGDRKVVICNADEGDPGAFMDRMLLESYPYRVLEGILIAARVVKAECAIIYIREEYAQAIAVLEHVIVQLREHGLFNAISPTFEILLFRGAGAFVCGEETALLESIEGRRGIPRQRPPFPVEHGLNGLPTLMNNVETFACVPVILADGGAAFTAIGTEHSHGTKAFALAGKVKQGGLIEVPIGVTVGEIVETFGGGAEEWHTIKAVMIGGPSGGCIAQRNFDLPVDYESLRQSGAMMGSGGLIVIDERDCLVDLSLYFLQFLRDESCGKCVLCREGVLQLCEWVESLTKSEPKPPDILDRIEVLARQIQQGSLCALGRTAPNMVLSALHEFRSEFEAHLRGACPAGKCPELTEFEITDACIGCTKCAQVCAADAITCEILEQARIDPAKCVKCGVCRSVCPEHAIRNRLEESSQSVSVPTAPPSDRSQTTAYNSYRMDGEERAFVPGQRLIEVVPDLPTLCHLKGVNESAHCMVCAVWDATLCRYVPGCEALVQRGHVYESRGERVDAFRRTAFELMLKRHDFRCGTCYARTSCRLLDGVKTYKAKKTKSGWTPPTPIVAQHMIYEGGKCVLCNRCAAVSEGWLSVHHRGYRSVISPEPNTWDDLPQSVATAVCSVCPTGALTFRKETHAI